MRLFPYTLKRRSIITHFLKLTYIEEDFDCHTRCDVFDLVVVVVVVVVVVIVVVVVVVVVVVRRG